ncbi:hypothetical protein J113_09570 [Mycobacterium tuberculosis CAS/NITR204]|uniref:HNH nuclease domain-containing protein n=1 Tax=Mycobacterium tuberculosis CAS/NITR204 TaxID=1310114 RepID=R4MHF5_MYCTX|nr:hypothetical protein J113_09570 [Mycobacterium tuberculosis CAS/NITR204]
MPSRRQPAGVAGEVALARRDSPARGGRHLGFAKALVYEMPHTLAALEVGRLSEWRATLIVRESACLDVEDRRALHAQLCADMSALDGMGDARIAAAARAIAYRLDAQAVVERAARAETERTVTIRPAPDTMTWVTALLPVARGVSVYAALKRAADTTFDDRTRGQVMADTLVERVTGQPAEAAQPVAVNLVLSDETLLAGDRAPAGGRRVWPHPGGRGPQPGARRLPTRSGNAAPAHRPGSGALVAMESRARRFPKGLAAFIGLRDQRCRMPYCDAPIRHRDHAQPHHRGGPTTATNGLGSCERCNYVKEAPGWRVSTDTDETGRHTAEFTTPTGMYYHCTAPPLPGPLEIDVSQVEARIGVALTHLHAA